MYLTIIKSEQTIDHRNWGITCLSFDKSSVNPQNVYESFESMHGLISFPTTFGGRPMRAIFYVEAEDHLSYQLMKDNIFSLFAAETEMTVIDSRQPTKLWKLKVASQFNIENLTHRAGRFTVEFISASPFADSDAPSIQTKAVNSFTISNVGNKVIDPRRDGLIITYTGASTNLSVKNNTTSDEWKYTGTTVASDNLKLDGIRSFKNGLSIFRNSNRQLIHLVPGENNFSLTGTSGSFTIKFEFAPKFI